MGVTSNPLNQHNHTVNGNILLSVMKLKATIKIFKHQDQ